MQRHCTGRLILKIYAIGDGYHRLEVRCPLGHVLLSYVVPPGALVWMSGMVSGMCAASASFLGGYQLADHRGRTQPVAGKWQLELIIDANVVDEAGLRSAFRSLAAELRSSCSGLGKTLLTGGMLSVPTMINDPRFKNCCSGYGRRLGLAAVAYNKSLYEQLMDSLSEETCEFVNSLGFISWLVISTGRSFADDAAASLGYTCFDGPLGALAQAGKDKRGRVVDEARRTRELCFILAKLLPYPGISPAVRLERVSTVARKAKSRVFRALEAPLPEIVNLEQVLLYDACIEYGSLWPTWEVVQRLMLEADMAEEVVARLESTGNERIKGVSLINFDPGAAGNASPKLRPHPAPALAPPSPSLAARSAASRLIEADEACQGWARLRGGLGLALSPSLLHSRPLTCAL